MGCHLGFRTGPLPSAVRYWTSATHIDVRLAETPSRTSVSYMTQILVRFSPYLQCELQLFREVNDTFIDTARNMIMTSKDSEEYQSWFMSIERLSDSATKYDSADKRDDAVRRTSVADLEDTGNDTTPEHADFPPPAKRNIRAKDSFKSVFDLFRIRPRKIETAAPSSESAVQFQLGHLKVEIFPNQEHESFPEEFSRKYQQADLYVGALRHQCGGRKAFVSHDGYLGLCP